MTYEVVVLTQQGANHIKDGQPGLSFAVHWAYENANGSRVVLVRDYRPATLKNGSDTYTLWSLHPGEYILIDDEDTQKSA